MSHRAELSSSPSSMRGDRRTDYPTLVRLRQLLTTKTALWLLGIALFTYICVYFAASSYRFITFRQGFDLAQNEQTIWNTSQGRWFETSPFVDLKYDFDDGPAPVELVLAVPYAIAPTTFTLLFLQTLALASGAIPLFLLARERMNVWAAWCFALAYLFHVTITRMNMYEFQIRSFLLAFFLFGFYFFEKQRFGLYVLMAVLMLSCKSEVVFTLPIFGLYAWLNGRSARWIVTPIVLSAAWALVVFGYVIPTFASGNLIGSAYGYGWLGNNFGEMFVTLVTRPLYVLQNVLTASKLEYIFDSFLLLLFLPLLEPRILLFALPNLALNLLGTRPVQYSVLFFYQPFVVGTFFLAAIYGVARIVPRFAHGRTAMAQVGIGGALLAASILFNLTWNNLALRLVTQPAPVERSAAAKQVIALIPPTASVAASSFIGPHLAQREALYFFPGTASYPFPRESVDYVVVDLETDDEPKAQEEIASLRDNPQWQVAAQVSDFILFQRRK